MRKHTLSAEVLSMFKDSFEYNPSTGVLRWKRSPAVNIKKGYIAGRLHTNGHLEVGICKKTYMVHHVIWALTHGKFPEATLVHINGNKRDNRLDNLTESGYGPAKKYN